MPDYDPGAPKILQYAAGPPPLQRGNGSSSGGVLSLSTVRTGYPGYRCVGTDACSGLNGSWARYDGMGWARHGTIPPPNAPFVPSITALPSTNASSTACVGKSHFATYGLAPRDRGKIRQLNGGTRRRRRTYTGFVPSHTTVPMGPHPPNTVGRPQGACGLAPVPRPTWCMPTARPTHHAPATHRCRPCCPQRCWHGTQSRAHEPYDRTPRNVPILRRQPSNS